MARFLSAAEQAPLLMRGVVDLPMEEEFHARLARSVHSNTPLRVKAGFDPTRPDLHLGHAVLLQKMRAFQDLGHTVVFVVGDFTAMVGDPTGQNDQRPRLTHEEVRAAAKTYTDQAFRVLDPSRTEVRENSEWLSKLSTEDIVALLAKSTVSRMLERNDFSARFEASRPIHLHEFFYPLLQAYDSVALRADIELGGTDQLFNLLMGRDLMPRYGLVGQMVMTTPILEGTDARKVGTEIVGKKMSKSADNYVGLRESPLEMFRKLMQVDDEVIFRYFDLLSRKSEHEIKALRNAQAHGADPRETKALFAREVIERFHDSAAAEDAAQTFQSVYGNNAVPKDIAEHTVRTEGDTLWIAKALSATGLVKSTGEGKRLVEQGGVEVDDQRVEDSALKLEVGKRYLLKVGSKQRRFAYVTVVR